MADAPVRFASEPGEANRERTNPELRNPASHLERDVALVPLALPSSSMLDSDLGGHYETETF
jgi:hypothetical protein